MFPYFSIHLKRELSPFWHFKYFFLSFWYPSPLMHNYAARKYFALTKPPLVKSFKIKWVVNNVFFLPWHSCKQRPWMCSVAWIHTVYIAPTSFYFQKKMSSVPIESKEKVKWWFDIDHYLFGKRSANVKCDRHYTLSTAGINI